MKLKDNKYQNPEISVICIQPLNILCSSAESFVFSEEEYTNSDFTLL